VKKDEKNKKKDRSKEKDELYQKGKQIEGTKTKNRKLVETRKKQWIEMVLL
jgi:hypothetical protein